MTHEEIKRHFESTPPPQEVDWKPCPKIIDSRLFLRNCYTGIYNFNGSLEMCPALWHLKDFYLRIKRNQPQEKSDENQSE